MTTTHTNSCDSGEIAAMIQQCNSLINADLLQEALTYVSACLEKTESDILYAYKAGIQHDLCEKDMEYFLSEHENPSPSTVKYSDCLESIRKAISILPQASYYSLLAKWLLNNEPGYSTSSKGYVHPRKDSQDQCRYAVEDGKLVLIYRSQDSEVGTREHKLSDSEAYIAIEKAIQMDPSVREYYELKLAIIMQYREYDTALSFIAQLKDSIASKGFLDEEAKCLQSLGKLKEARQLLENELLPQLVLSNPESYWENMHPLVTLLDIMMSQKDYASIIALLDPIKDAVPEKGDRFVQAYYRKALNEKLLESKDYVAIVDKMITKTAGMPSNSLLEAMLADKQYSLLIEAFETGLGKDKSFHFLIPPAQKAWMLIWLHTIVGNANKALQAILDFDANSLHISVPPSEPMAAEEIDGELYLDSYYQTPYEAHDEIISSLNPYFRFTLPYELMPLDHFKLLLSKFYYNHADVIDNEARFLGRELQINADQYTDNEPSSLASVQLKYKLLVELQKYNTDLKEGHSEFLNFLAINLTYTLSLLQEQEIMKEKEAERIRIISNLSHSIKNLVRSVINPLHNLRQELPEKMNTIDFALRAANLIREMVNAINASQSIDIQNFIWDAHHPDGESLSLKEIVHACLVYSIGNMFDFKYFNEFSVNYFPRSLGISERGRIQQQWEQISSSGNLDKVLEFAKQHLFKCSIEMECIADLRIGNAKSSAVNMTILLQEIIFNAIKYTSFVPLEKRFVSLQLIQNHDQIRLEVSNSCDPETIARSTGQGMGIIKDFAKGLNCKPLIRKTGITYSITMEFNNIWRNDVQDSIH